jgi:hypothetical protein
MAEVLFEFFKVGAIVRVTATDVTTGTEIVIQGPATASPALLQRVALNKLSYVLKRQKKKGVSC